MIQIDFDPRQAGTLTPAQQKWWDDWEARAKKATDDVLEAWEKSQEDPNDTTYDKIFDKASIREVWTELKNWLLPNVFNDKCAYCETPVVRATLHAEHYRPKGRVTQNGKKARIKDDKGQEIDHPGYFWLAFHWTNLLPACEWCNTVNGKRNEFPIPQTTYLSVLKKLTQAECNNLKEQVIKSTRWPEIFYFQPVDLDDKEGRLLLHPYFDNPRKSLVFDDFGSVIATGTGDDKLRGEWSIKVYNLNDAKIKPERQKAQDEALIKFENITMYHRFQGLSIHEARLKAKTDNAMAKYLSSKAPYSAAVLDFLRSAHGNYF